MRKLFWARAPGDFSHFVVSHMGHAAVRPCGLLLDASLSLRLSPSCVRRMGGLGGLGSSLSTASRPGGKEAARCQNMAGCAVDKMRDFVVQSSCVSVCVCFLTWPCTRSCTAAGFWA
ncbi:unnamed protein product [Effrenium voratum]|uniref:Uncharacterized protein n=1 Tax=Effrenium voratum TaxID=2562239 RepID=A0AA36ML83_9DINO|nr:unnamed protein product [Effrenium voratum]